MFPIAMSGLCERLAHLGRIGVGIDLGRESVRVVALRRHAGAMRLLGLASSSLPVPAADGARGVSADAVPVLRETVRAACHAAPWRPRRVVMAVPAALTLLRALEVDAGAGDEDTADAVERAARALPMPLAALRLAWAAADARHTTHAGEGVDVPVAARAITLVAVRRETVATCHALAAACGLGRPVIDVDLLAAAQGLRAGGVAAPVATGSLLVDIGSDSLRALFPAEAPPTLLRVAPVPRDGTLDTLAAAVVSLADEVQAAARQPVQAIVLCGGRALVEGLPEAVTGQCGRSAVLADAFAGVERLRAQVGSPEPEGAPGALWAIACGLAWRAAT